MKLNTKLYRVSVLLEVVMPPSDFESGVEREVKKLLDLPVNFRVREAEVKPVLLENKWYVNSEFKMPEEGEEIPYLACMDEDSEFNEDTKSTIVFVYNREGEIFPVDDVDVFVFSEKWVPATVEDFQAFGLDEPDDFGLIK